MQAALISGYRCAMSMPHRGPTIVDRRASAEVLAACGKLGMVTLLALARLRLLVPVVQHGPQALLRLFDYLAARGSGWPASIVHLHWGEGSLGTGVSALPAWVALARSDPVVWHRGLARVERRATAAHVDECLRVVWRRNLDGIFYQGRLPCLRVLPLSRLNVASCATIAALPSLYCWRMAHPSGEGIHGARHPTRAAAFGSTCSSCCVEFHTRPRLLWHLMYSVPACLAAYAFFFDPRYDATVDVAEQSDRAESRALRKAGDYDRVAKMPAVRIHGCALPALAPVLSGEMPVVLPPRVPDGPAEGDAQRAPAAVHRYLNITVYCVLHFFSGQRRPGDYQDWLDQALAVTHYPVWVIGLGVAIDAKLCDLSCSGGVARWLDLAIAGRVVMVLGGPPCETWSAAMWNGGSRAIGAGPRAVRSSEQLWGLPDLDAGERQQVALGNALLRTVILFLAAARVYGFAAVMTWGAHDCPAGCRMPLAPPSWKLPDLTFLARVGGTECVHLDQCCCGTPWKKPTRLFAVGIPELVRLVARLPGGGRCCPAPKHKHVTLSGKGDDGVCRTAPAKTYNSVTCKVLADATFGSIARFLSGHVDVMAAERGLPVETAMLHVPTDHYDPDPWTAWTHDRARAST